jgi:putative ABC transport system permease protein
MFFRLLLESFVRQRRRKLLAGTAILLGVTAVTAMLALATTIGDRIHRELAVYGANIILYPQADNLEVQVGGVDLKPVSADAYLHTSDLPRLKSIFWSNNITGVSPELPTQMKIEATDVTVMGLWFHHALGFGASTMTTGAPDLHPWWKLNGAWPVEPTAQTSTIQAVAGSALAAKLGLHVGDKISLEADSSAATPLQNDKVAAKQAVIITGIVSTGDETDQQLLMQLADVQMLSHLPDDVRRVYVTAKTKPEDAFARKNPDTLSPQQRDIWYCRPYANSIAYQIREAIPGAQAEQIRRVEQNEGKVLSRISGLMWLISAAALLAAAFAVSAAMATAVLERRGEIGLMRSLGASQGAIALLFYSETGLLALMAGAIGYLAGSSIAAILGHRIFSGDTVTAFSVFNPVLLPVVLSLALLVAVAGSTPSIRSALRLDPAAVLREDA